MQLRGKLLHHVRYANQAHLKMEALHQRAVVRRKPQHGGGHVAILLAGKLRNVERLVAPAVVGEQGHLQRMAAAAKQAGAGAWKLVQIDAFGGGQVLVYRVGYQRARILIAHAPRISARGPSPLRRIVHRLDDRAHR